MGKSLGNLVNLIRKLSDSWERGRERAQEFTVALVQ